MTTSTRAGNSGRTVSTLLLVVLCAAQLMDTIDLSDVTVALPSIQSDLGMTPGALGWVVSAYLLGYGGFLLLGGRAADVLGRRRVFRTAVAVLGAVSVVATFSPGPEVLIASRLIKGVAAGFLAPAALSLITTLWPEGPARGRAIGAFATAGAAGFIGGLVLGGLLTQASWRLVFALPIPVALAVLLLAPRLIPHDTRDRIREPLDALGALLITLSFSALVVFLTEAPILGWASPSAIALAGAFVALLILFVVREKSTAYPLLPLGFLHRPATIGSSIGIAALWAAYTGFAFLTTLAMQDVLGWSPLASGLAFVPLGIVNGLLAPRMGRLAGRIGPRPVVLVGMLLLTVSYALFLRIGPEAGFVTVFLPIMVVNGLGLACSFAPLNLAATNGVAAERQGLAASVLNTAQQLGGAVGLAIVTAVTAGVTGLSAYPIATLAVIALSAIGIIGALALPDRTRGAAHNA